MEDKKRLSAKILWAVSIIIVIMYPLRHVGLGIDLWDGGYNYANFTYSGLDYMDSMWYFATFLANGLGHVFHSLPYGNTMLGMNIYTAIVQSFIGTMAYVFCVKKLRIPALWAFVGQLTALALCWAPGAVLYNYLTYALLLFGTILLYLGLAEEKNILLVAAGICLGLNVGVRFSNLVQMGLILALWAYGFLTRKKLSKVMQETGFCVLGYAGAFGLFFILVGLKYGFGSYIEGVMRLFAMTETATDYTPGYMLIGMVWGYYESIYWFKRFALYLAAGVLLCLILPGKWEKAKKAVCIAGVLAVNYWLFKHGYFTLDYATYNAVYYPAVTMLLATQLLALWKIFGSKKAKEEPAQRLLALLVMLTVWIASLGGNNAMYSNLNNLFLVFPGFLWVMNCFVRETGKMVLFPIKCLLVSITCVLIVQAAGFGVRFVYEEATGGRMMTEEIAGASNLEGIRTGEKKAEALADLKAYLTEENLQNERVILYGNIPGVSYYMEMAPALNVWPDLRSYPISVMEEDLAAAAKRGEEEGMPVTILGRDAARYADGETEELYFEPSELEKLDLLLVFLEEHGYVRDHRSEAYAVYLPKENVRE